MFAGVTTLATALILLCGSALATPSIQPNMNNICVLVPNNMAISSGNDCSTYYTCNNGVATLQSCSPGLNFNKDTQQCTPQTVTTCSSGSGSDTLTACAGQQNGTWAPVAGSCGGYYYCGLNGVALRGNCPQGETFNYQAQRCTFNSAVPCTETNVGNGDSIDGNGTTVATVNLCNYVANGIYFASPSSCSGWNLCTNNIMTSGSCPAGYVFNAQSENCDYATDTNCNQVTNDPELSGAAAYGGGCSTSGLLKAASTCAGYYQCDGTNYVLMTCISGLYFDTVSQTCVNRLQARNNCDRCAGSASQFVNAYSNAACTEYLYCQNGVEKGSGTCPSGSYFSETSGACVMGVQPLIGCCNPAAFVSMPTPDSDPIPAPVPAPVPAPTTN